MGQDNIKAVTVYASIIMTFKCSYCSVPLKIKSETPPKNNFSFICPKCKNRIIVKLNKREFYRKDVSIPITYSFFSIDDPSDRRAKKGMMIDISKEGLCFMLNTFTIGKVGDILTMFFSLPPQNKLLTVKGKIVRINKNGSFKISVHFLDLNEYQNQIIGFFLLP